MPRVTFLAYNAGSMTKLRAFFHRHPVLWDVVRWSLPALALGAFLRVLLLSYLPYAYWGSDSKSYYSFAHQLLSRGDISLDEKRRYLYPILMLPVSLLPGAPLRWVAVLQHLLGLISVLPLAYVVRKSLRFWKWWIVPVTVAYAGLPVFLWYEHELLGEAFFFAMFLWTFGGWVAWATQTDPARARRLFWWFFVPLALFLLTKPSGRFILPGLVCGLLFLRAWRVLDWRRWLALVLLLGATLTVGSKKQGAWLLYVATFPLTQLNTPANAEYKEELRPYAEPYIRDIDAYYRLDRQESKDHPAPFDFLETPSEETAPPLWGALDRDPQKKRQLYLSLALEGMKARPLDFLYLGLERLVASAPMSEFDLKKRFVSAGYAKRQQGSYSGAQKDQADNKSTSVPMAFGLPKNAPLPPYEELSPRITPAPGGWAENTVVAWCHAVQHAGDIVTLPKPKADAPASEWAVTRAHITVLGWWLIGSVVLSLIYWRTLGTWVLAALGYLAGVFLISVVETRYFALAWLVFLPVLAVPLDLLLRCILERRNA